MNETTSYSWEQMFYNDYLPMIMDLLATRSINPSYLKVWVSLDEQDAGREFGVLRWKITDWDYGIGERLTFESELDDLATQFGIETQGTCFACGTSH